MTRFNLGYSLRNIPVPTKNSYLKSLIAQTESFIKRIRWRVFWYEASGNQDEQLTQEVQPNKFGLKSNNSPPPNHALTNFENEIYKLISSIKFRKEQNDFQEKMARDLDSLKSSKKLVVEADKTSNLYQIEPEKYKKLVHENVTKDYKLAGQDEQKMVNLETKKLATKLEIEDRVEQHSETTCFISLKDHKENFYSNPKCRLINPAKSNLGHVSKCIMERMVAQIRKKTGVNQWKSTSDVIQWFKDVPVGKKARFIKFDIVEFYPSISMEMLDRALEFAAPLTQLTADEKEIIKLTKQSFLFNEGKCWVKKSDVNFDVTMGSLDGAETSELIGVYILHKIKSIIPQDHLGLYRDDGLAIIENATSQKLDKLRKKLHSTFQREGLKITLEIHGDSTNYLDVELFLKDKSYKPYKKPNDTPMYINTKSNHPPPIIKNIPDMISKRLSNISSNEQLFNESTHDYTSALEASGYTEPLSYQAPQQQSPKKKRKRTRKVVWFNPPYSTSVTTDLGRRFFSILDRSFPKEHRFHKILNRNTVKLSYSCTPNMGRILKNHNKSVLQTETKDASPRECNCRVKSDCPLQGHCLVTCSVYQADVETENGETYPYIGLADGEFKTRWYNHNKSFRTVKYKNDTELSKLIWDLKDKNIQNVIKWKIIAKCSSYRAGSKFCNLCLTEKLHILKNPASINKRTEIVSKCRHRRKYLINMCN